MATDQTSQHGLNRVPVHQSVVRKPLFAGVEFEMIASQALFALCFFLALRDFAAAIGLSVVVLIPMHMAVAAVTKKDQNLLWYTLRLAMTPQSYAPSPELDAPSPAKPPSVK